MSISLSIHSPNKQIKFVRSSELQILVFSCVPNLEMEKGKPLAVLSGLLFNKVMVFFHILTLLRFDFVCDVFLSANRFQYNSFFSRLHRHHRVSNAIEIHRRKEMEN